MAGGRNTFTIRGMDELRGLETLVRSIGDKAEQHVRPAAKAGADVLYEEVKRRVAGIKAKTGTLAASIYRAYSPQNSPTPTVAEYHVSWRTSRSGLPNAPHGHLIEQGHWQRYAVYTNKRGELRTAVRPEMRGKPKPKRRDPQSVKDAYYMPRPGGPIFVGPQAFIRPSASKFPEALDAMEKHIIGAIAEDFPFMKG